MKTSPLEIVRRVVDEMTEAERLLLILTRLERLSPSEVAQVLGIPGEEAITRVRAAEASLCGKLTGALATGSEGNPKWGA